MLQRHPVETIVQVHAELHKGVTDDVQVQAEAGRADIQLRVARETGGLPLRLATRSSCLPSTVASSAHMRNPSLSTYSVPIISLKSCMSLFRYGPKFSNSKSGLPDFASDFP